MNKFMKRLQSVDEPKIGRHVSWLVMHSSMCNVYNVNNVTQFGSNHILYVFLQLEPLHSL